MHRHGQWRVCSGARADMRGDARADACGGVRGVVHAGKRGADVDDEATNVRMKLMRERKGGLTNTAVCSTAERGAHEGAGCPRGSEVLTRERGSRVLGGERVLGGRNDGGIGAEDVGWDGACSDACQHRRQG